MVGTVYTSTTLGTFPGLYIGTFPLSVDRPLLHRPLLHMQKSIVLSILYLLQMKSSG